ncbi:MAG TPA: heavy metal-associated domain-containing protein, partial [Ignavibacteria bacterium]|nr:heavy metal-associated domain-containing protein [Ignavibacteria bacterium]
MNDTGILSKDTKASVDYNVIELDIEGMDCPSCAMKIERRLNKLNGVENAKVDLANETASFVITGAE